jgi:hypothetical protein
MNTHIDQSLEDYVEIVEAECRASDNYIKQLLWILPLVSLIVGFCTYQIIKLHSYATHI